MKKTIIKDLALIILLFGPVLCSFYAGKYEGRYHEPYIISFEGPISEDALKKCHDDENCMDILPLAESESTQSIKEVVDLQELDAGCETDEECCHLRPELCNEGNGYGAY